jgi:branched-chain amino acid transport system permease protein
MLGLAGATYAFTEGRISPNTFGFAQVDVEVIVMLAFGGIGTLFGPILGAVTFTVVGEVLIEFGQLRVLIFGTLIVLLFLFLPRGVIPTVRSFLVQRRAARATASPD